MRTAINANIANAVAANQLNVVVVVRDADHRGASGSRSRLFGPFRGKKSVKSSDARKHPATLTAIPAMPGEIAEYPRMLTACQRGRQWRRSQQLSTLLHAGFALGIAG